MNERPHDRSGSADIESSRVADGLAETATASDDLEKDSAAVGVVPEAFVASEVFY